MLDNHRKWRERERPPSVRLREREIGGLWIGFSLGRDYRRFDFDDAYPDKGATRDSFGDVEHPIPFDVTRIGIPSRHACPARKRRNEVLPYSCRTLFCNTLLVNGFCGALPRQEETDLDMSGDSSQDHGQEERATVFTLVVVIEVVKTTRTSRKQKKE
ncbi:hypothetical protein SCHPADRAFT_729270 [Schizopora paradoxa]|uniref:Uncharacterized protein n=1 Tax=Schizopora paradoxa TaxID=27342 RepID=A0A0H2R7C3_9AGAM|nr:hypothetical protein SCHPADRAFT_729270 [Schizopora paradoxa]